MSRRTRGVYYYSRGRIITAAANEREIWGRIKGPLLAAALIWLLARPGAAR